MSVLSLTGKRWLFVGGAEPAATADAASLRAHLLRERSLEEMGGNPYDPSVFPDAAKAADRVRRAIADGERIAIFGDYDCDGVTSTAQLVRALRRRGVTPLVILPHRERDGYGLKMPAIERCAEASVTLLLTADNGIAAVDAVARAQDRGIDVVILDHHHCPARLPPAHAIVHPALSPAFPPPHPAAAGVVFLFLHALEGKEWPGRPTDLALAAIGTVADLVPLKGFNRRLVQDGLTALRRGELEPPLRALLRATGVSETLTSGDIAFRIAPRINAAGRMAEPDIALQALLDGGDALGTLDRLNTQRQQEMLACMEAAQPGAADRFLCLADAAYQPGIVGLIAGKLTEKHGRPSLVASVRGNTCVASLRSIAGYHVTEALERCADLLESFGGHAQAAGCTFPLSSLPRLRERLNADVRERLDDAALVPSLTLDARLHPSTVSLALCNALADLEPFGQDNPQPAFLLPGVRVSDLRRVGDGGRHLQARADGIKAVGFHLGHLDLRTDVASDLACALDINRWNGRVEAQLVIKDIRPSAEFIPSAVEGLGVTP